jgi:hypothetical protein
MKRKIAWAAVLLGIFLATLAGGIGGFYVLVLVFSESTPPLDPIDDAYALTGPVTCDAEVGDAPALPLGTQPDALLICADLTNKHLWTAPADLVEGDLTPLVDALGDLEPAPLDDYACTMVGGPAYELVLRFPGDRYARVHGDTGGCGVVTVGSVEYFGATKVLDTALALVEEQRTRTGPPAELPPIDLSCDRTFTEQGTPTSYTGEPGDLVRIVSCWQPNAPELGAWTQAELNESDVRVLARDLDRRAEVGGDPNGLRCPGGLGRHYFQHLVGQTSWGDVLLIAGECRRFIVVDTRGGGETIVWRPSTDAQRLLDNLRR